MNEGKQMREMRRLKLGDVCTSTSTSRITDNKSAAAYFGPMPGNHFLVNNPNYRRAIFLFYSFINIFENTVLPAKNPFNTHFVLTYFTYFHPSEGYI